MINIAAGKQCDENGSSDMNTLQNQIALFIIGVIASIVLASILLLGRK